MPSRMCYNVPLKLRSAGRLGSNERPRPRGPREGSRARGAMDVSHAMSEKKSSVERDAYPGLEVAVQRQTLATVLPSDVLSGMLGWALSVSDLFQLSLVCSRWLHAARSAECWSGHQIDIACMSLCGQELQRWWPIWRLSQSVLLTYFQRDAFKQPYPSPYLVWHKWGRWPPSAEYDDWHDIRLGGSRWLVKLTEQRAPDAVGIQQSWSPHLRASLILGWTTATSPRTLSRLWPSRLHRLLEMEGELITVRVCQRIVPFAQSGNAAAQDKALKVHLDRETRAVMLKTFANDHISLQRPRIEAPVAPQRRLRFFLAMPRPAGANLRRLPRVALQPSDCSVLEM